MTLYCFRDVTTQNILFTKFNNEYSQQAKILLLSLTKYFLDRGVNLPPPPVQIGCEKKPGTLFQTAKRF